MNFDRRQLILGAATAALPLSAQSPSKVRTAVIGTGNRGSYLLQGVLDQPGASVAMLCDNKPDRLDKAATAAARDNARTTPDWRKVIDNDEVDAVFIATPPYLHAEMAVAALKRGKHVYCEKPIGITAAQVRQVVEAARASKKVFTAGQQLRSVQRFAKVVKQIHEGLLGDIVMVKAQRHATADLPHDGSSGDWFFDVSKGGGYLVEQSVHNLDLCNWVLNAHPTRCTGLGAINFYKNQPAGRTIFDQGSLTYDYPKGIKMSFTQNVFHPRGLPGGNQYVYVYGTKGALDLFAPIPTFFPIDPKAEPVPVSEKGPSEYPHTHIASFYKAITENGPNPAGITIGAEAALTAILGHEAMVKEKMVTWDDLGVRL
jgi:predicted dehydrogenase